MARCRAHYAGMSSDSAALPGVTVIGRDGRGRVPARRVSEMDDRVEAPELLAILDRTLGTHGPEVAPPGDESIDPARSCASTLAAGVAARTRATHGALVGDFAALFLLGVGPGLGRHILDGPWQSIEGNHGVIDPSAAIAVRAPFDEIAAFQLTVTGGYTVFDANGASGFTASARAGIWFAYWPTCAFTLDVGAATHRLGDDVDHAEVFATFGLAWLVRTR